MQQPVSFDADDFICQMQRATAAALALARATITDPEQLAGYEAQAATMPALEHWVRVQIGLREAGHHQNFIAAVAGALAGQILDSVLLNSPHPDEARKVFVSNMAMAASGRNKVFETWLQVDGQPAGRA